MAARTGIPSILRITLELCRLLSKFSPVLSVRYAGNPALLAALASAQAACGVLAQEAAKVREVEQYT